MSVGRLFQFISSRNNLGVPVSISMQRTMFMMVLPWRPDIPSC